MQNETRMIWERLRCWGPSRLTHYCDLRSSQWRKPQKLHRPLFEWTKGLLWSPFPCAKWKATSVTADEFYGAVIPRNFHEFGCRLFLKHTPWAVCLRHMKTFTIRQKQEFSRQIKNQKKSFVTTNFCYASCIRIKIFKVNKFRQRLICSSMVAEGFHFQFFFLILQSLSFVVKDNSFLSSKLITVQLHACRSLYDRWLTTVSHGYVY